MNKPKCTKLPAYTSDVADEYIQNLRKQAYAGRAPSLTFDSTQKAAFILFNPKGSGVYLFVNRVRVLNASKQPIQANAFLYAAFTGNVKRSFAIANGNTIGLINRPSRGRILYGNGIKLQHGVNSASVVVPPYTTTVAEVNGARLIAPGASQITELVSLGGPAKGTIIYEWWEEPICRKHKNVIRPQVSIQMM